jgi:TonB family protein
MKTLHMIVIYCVLFICGCIGKKGETSQAEKENIPFSADGSEDAASKTDMNDAWITEGDDTGLTNTWAQDAYGDNTGGSDKDHWVDQEGNTVYKKTEVPPEFVGGSGALRKYLDEEIRLPGDAEEGKVFVAFIVADNGTIVDARVVRGVKKSMDEEALRLIKEMPKWDPAMRDGKPVYAVHGIPVTFKP